MDAMSLGLIVVWRRLHCFTPTGGFSGHWPGHDKTSMVEHVIGRSRDMRAPSLPAALFVAAGLLTAALLVNLYERDRLSGMSALLVRTGFWSAALVFMTRGLAGYVPLFFRYAEGTPFHHLELIVYSSLCLLIFAGFVAVGHDGLSPAIETFGPPGPDLRSRSSF